MKRSIRERLALSVILTGLTASAICLPSFAQNVQIPAQTDPGLLAPPTSEEVERQRQQQKELPGPEETAPTTEINVPEQSPNVQIEVPKFTVNQVIVEGVTIFSEAEIDQIVSAYEGREITLDDLEKAVESINRLYRDRGYLTTQAYVPPQEVDQGSVTIRVVEGRVGDLCVVGNKFYRPNAIIRNIDVEPGEVFNLRALESGLNRSNLQNNFRLKATLSPGDETGETNVRIDTTERQPWQISPTFDNQGRPFIGLYRGGVELTNESLLGYGDRLSARYLGAEGTNVALGSYFFPVGKRGDEIGINYGYSRVDVDLGVPVEIIGKAHSAGILWSHPFDYDRNWVGDLGFNFRQITSYINDSRDSLDEIRSLQAGLNFNKIDSIGRTFARVQGSLGMDIFGGNAQFFKTEGFLTRLFTLPHNNVLILRAYGQWTPDALPSAEAFQLGGAYSVRGYTEGLLVGDRGYALTVEDRFPIPFLANLSPWLAERLQGAVFFDVGQTWLDSSNLRFVGGLSNTSERTTLMGAGFGIRARLTQYLQGFMDVGFGLLDRSNVEPLAQPTARIHFGIRSNLLPETYRARGTSETCITPSGANVKPVQTVTPISEPDPNSPTNIIPESRSDATFEDTTQLVESTDATGKETVVSLLDN